MSKTLAEEIAEESDRLRRRVIHHSLPKRPLTLDEACKLHEAMIGSSGIVYDITDKE